MAEGGRGRDRPSVKTDLCSATRRRGTPGSNVHNSVLNSWSVSVLLDPDQMQCIAHLLHDHFRRGRQLSTSAKTVNWHRETLNPGA